jgi:hypothetical protein
MKRLAAHMVIFIGSLGMLLAMLSEFGFIGSMRASEVRRRAAPYRWLTHFDQRDATTRGRRPSPPGRGKALVPAVTVAVLSCRRHDLLAGTVATFERWNTYPITRRLLLDCDNSTAAAEAVRRSAGHRDYEIVVAPVRLPGEDRETNILKNLQALYDAVSTPYVYFT